MRKLIIDCQILQTPAFDRGMGKYTLSLLSAFLALNKKTKHYGVVELVLSKNLTTDKKRLDDIRKQVPGAELVLLDLPTDIAVDIDKKYEQAVKVISDYVAEVLKGNHQIDFLITSPFFVGFPAVFPSQDDVGKYLIIYDLIPQKIWYLQRIFPDEIYFKHFGLFTEADGLLTISQAVRDDLLDLGLKSEKIASIDGGPFSRPLKTTEKLPEILKEPYILMPSAPIIHKNNERAVKAFRIFNKSYGDNYRLYITSNFDDETKARLQSLSTHIHFTGNISDNELAAAYNKADAVLFPSLSEGLGMPVLEASYYNTPVACSDIPVLSELSAQGFYQFDPTDVEDIAKTLSLAVSRQDWDVHRKACAKTLQKYTWERSARLLMEKLQEQEPQKKKYTLQIRMPKPDHDSPAAQLGEQLYMRLQEGHNIAVKFSNGSGSTKPSYVAHLAEGEIPNANTLDITNKRRLLKRTPTVRLEYHDCSLSLRRTIELSVERKTQDKALGLKAWNYYNSSGKKLSLSDIVEILSEGK